MTQNDFSARAHAAAEDILAARYPKASYAFVTGSIIRGEGRKGSDIDLVVMFPEVDAAWREAFFHDTFPVEVFAHDRQTLAWFIENDASLGYPVMAHMIATGHIIGRDIEAAGLTQTQATQFLSSAPPKNVIRFNELRYIVSDLLEDLRADRPAPEVRAIAAQLHQPLGDLILLGRCEWSGKGKWLYHLLNQADADLAHRFDQAFLRAANGDRGPLVALALAELDRHGGLYFDGDRRIAPASARKTTSK